VPRVALAQRIGGLRLILRNADDKGSDGPPLVQESDVFIDPTRGAPTPGGGQAAQVVEMISGGGSNGGSVLVGPGPQPAPAQSTRTEGAAAAAPQSETAQREPSLYEQANAIAQQLQKAVAPSPSR
jgi:pilus assembly protein CpaB